MIFAARTRRRCMDLYIAARGSVDRFVLLICACRPLRGAALHALLLSVVLILAGCGGEDGPVASGGELQGGERIVVLSPAVAVMLRDIGVADRIVGKHDYDVVLPGHVVSVGHQEAIDYEALLGVSPTHVIIEWGSRPMPPRLVELAERHHWELVNVRLLTLDEIARTVDDLAVLFGVVEFGGDGTGRPTGMGVPEKLRVVPRFADPAGMFDSELPSAGLARAWSRRGEGFEDIGGVLLLSSTDPPGVLGPGSFHHQILERIGGTPAVVEGGPWMELDLEDIRRLAPSAIVLVSPRGPDTGPEPVSLEELRDRLGRISELNIPAVRLGRLGLIDDPLSLLPGTSMAGFADDLASLLGSWQADGEVP